MSKLAGSGQEEKIFPLGSYFMTDDAELIVKGRVIEEYAATKARLASLDSEAHRLSGKLKGLATQIVNYSTAVLNDDLSFLQTNFAALMDDLKTALQKKSDLAQKLRDYGIGT